MFKIYGMSKCPYCERALELLDMRGDPYVYYNVQEDSKRWDELVKWNEGSERVTLPAIWDEDEFIGGFTELREYLSQLDASAVFIANMAGH